MLCGRPYLLMFNKKAKFMLLRSFSNPILKYKPSTILLCFLFSFFLFCSSFLDYFFFCFFFVSFPFLFVMSHTSHLQERSHTSIGLLFLQSCLLCLWSLKVWSLKSEATLRQDPLIWVFGHFFDFFALWYRRGREASSVKILYKKFESWSNVPPKLLACIGFPYKVVHKIGHLRKFNRSREIEFNFLPLGLSPWNLAHLFSMLLATEVSLRFFNFCLGT